MGWGEQPPNICIELALWERFPGWGPHITDKMTLAYLRTLFAVIEQREVDRNAIEDLGKPNQEAADAKMKMMEQERAEAKLRQAAATRPQLPQQS